MKQFVEKIQEQFDKMCATGMLFRTNVPGDKIWETYINSFEEGTNPIFRDPNSSVHACNTCNSFIRRYGNIVTIDENGFTTTLFSNYNENTEYKVVAAKLDELIKSQPIINVFFETYEELNFLPYESCNKTQASYKLGIAQNHKMYSKEEAEKYGVVSPSEVRTFNHFHLSLPAKFVDKSGKSIEAIMATYRDKYSVFKRAMEEISLDTLNLVKDLINQGSLLDGTAHLHAIDEIITAKSLYTSTIWNKDNWLWTYSYNIDERVAKFRNTAIGTLCVELTQGKELNEACKMWNKMVDPVNYHKATAPITQKQIEEAQKFVTENGYLESFDRRLAVMEDINVTEIKHVATSSTVEAVTIFDNVKATSTQHKKAEFDKLEVIGIEKFMKDILPTCTSIEAYLENRMEGNLVTLTTAKNKESKPIFKWDNNFSWTFNGNLAGKSQIKDAVKSRGGNTDAVVRISIHFPGTTDDYDLYSYEPNKNCIYFGNKRTRHASSGMLDLDAQGGDGHFPPEKRVENLTYTDFSKMPKGEYQIKVNNYSGRGVHTKFNVEVEINGDITTMEYVKTSKSNTVDIGTLVVKENIVFNPQGCTILESKTLTKEVWNLETNKFHKVNLVCLSPNHWGEHKTGNLHYMFMLDGCKTNLPVRGFHNENLLPDLLQHKKVMEVLGNTAMITPTPKQLSGLGFNSTVKDELIVKCSGNFKRMLKIQF